MSLSYSSPMYSFSACLYYCYFITWFYVWHCIQWFDAVGVGKINYFWKAVHCFPQIHGNPFFTGRKKKNYVGGPGRGVYIFVSPRSPRHLSQWCRRHLERMCLGGSQYIANVRIAASSPVFSVDVLTANTLFPNLTMLSKHGMSFSCAFFILCSLGVLFNILAVSWGVNVNALVERSCQTLLWFMLVRESFRKQLSIQ